MYKVGTHHTRAYDGSSRSIVRFVYALDTQYLFTERKREQPGRRNHNQTDGCIQAKL